MVYYLKLFLRCWEERDQRLRTKTTAGTVPERAAVGVVDQPRSPVGVLGRVGGEGSEGKEAREEEKVTDTDKEKLKDIKSDNRKVKNITPSNTDDSSVPFASVNGDKKSFAGRKLENIGKVLNLVKGEGVKSGIARGNLQQYPAFNVPSMGMRRPALLLPP